MAKTTPKQALIREGINHLITLGLLDNQDDVRKLIPINAGTVNYNFRIDASNRSILFKIFENNHLLPVNRRKNFSIQQDLSLMGLAPEPLYLSKDERYYCEAWIDSAETLLLKKQNKLDSEPQSLEVNVTDSLIPRLAKALFNVHEAPITAPILDLPAHLKTYWQNIKTTDTKLINEYQTMLSFCEAYIEQNKTEFVLCHNDLHIDHICANSDIIFDWEYAAFGCKYYDIACCVLSNALTEEQTNKLCHEYAQLSQQNPDLLICSVKKVLKLAAFTFKLWHLSMDCK